MKELLEMSAGAQSTTAQELRRVSKSISELKDGLRRVEDSGSASLNSRALRQIQTALDMQSQTLDGIVSANILRALAFPAIRDRYEGIEQAHLNTLRWFFEEDDPSDARLGVDKIQARALFTSWLKHGTGILHVSGKLGSGKSTLMKFFVDHPKTRAGLEAWAEGHTLVVASFYFWRAGHADQRSLSGLLRSLLYDCLSADPSLISLVLPEIWGSTRDKPWLASHYCPTDEDIRQAFSRLIESFKLHTDRRFCFFIDGLDEYEEKVQMDHRDMVTMLQQWATSAPKQVKLCLSSREDNVFMNAFPDDKRIRLHILTLSDMAAYAHGRLSNVVEPAGLAELVPQIVEKAQGIFLWAALAVKEIRRRCENQDDEDLESVLDYFPSDLEELFRYILYRLIHPQDRAMAFRTFEMVAGVGSANFKLLLWEQSFLVDYVKDPGFAMYHPREPALEAGTARQRLERARAQVNGWCRGLVDIHWSAHDTDWAPEKPWISFAHRSIHDFLATDEVNTSFQKVIGDFDWMQPFSQMLLAGLQSLGRPPRDMMMHHLQRIVEVRAGAGLDREPPYSFLCALDHFRSPWFESMLPSTARLMSGTILTEFRHGLLRIATGPDLKIRSPRHTLAGRQEVVGTRVPTNYPALSYSVGIPGHPYPAWKLQRLEEDALDENGALVSLMMTAALIGYEKPRTNLDLSTVAWDYSVLDVFVAHPKLCARLLPGFKIWADDWSEVDHYGFLSHDSHVGVLGHFLMAFFLSSRVHSSHGDMHPVFSFVTRPYTWEPTSEQAAAWHDHFGQTLERLLRIDPEHPRFEAHGTFAMSGDQFLIILTFTIGQHSEKPRWRKRGFVDDGELSNRLVQADTMIESIPDVSEEHTWTLRDLIEELQPSNKEVLLRMLDAREADKFLPTGG